MDAPNFGSGSKEKAFQLPGCDPQRLGGVVGSAHKYAAFYKGGDEHREIAGLGLFNSAFNEFLPESREYHVKGLPAGLVD